MLIGLLLAASPAGALRRDHYFQSISSADGLAQNTVPAMLQDDQGFVWIATQGGLHRYDGYEFLRFQHDPADAGSLPESFLTTIAHGRRSSLWLGMNAHFIARLDLRTGAIERHEPAEEVADPRRNQVAAIREAADGTLWLGTGAGVEHYDPLSHQRTPVLQLAGEGRVDRRGMPRSVELDLDDQGLLWVASDGGVFRIETNSRSYLRVGPERPALGLHRDRLGTLWVGTVDGLFRVRDGQTLEQVMLGDGRPVPPVWRIASDSGNQLWLALLAGNLLRLDTVGGKAEPVLYDPEMPAGLPERRIASLMVDRSDLLWLGGESTGIATAHVDGSHFSLLFDAAKGGDGTSSNNLRSLLQTADGSFWVGAESDGLKRVDLRSGRFENFIDVIEAAVEGGTIRRGVRVLGLAEAEDGHVMVGTDHGPFELDPTRHTARALAAGAARGPLPADARFRSVTRARDGSAWWFGTDSLGVARLDAATRTWTLVPIEPTLEAHNQPMIHHIQEDSHGALWISSMKSLVRYEPDSGKLRHYRHDPADPESLAGELVRGTVESARGRLWVATHSGLCVADLPARDQPLRFTRFASDAGLPSNTIYGVLEDAQGGIWASSNLGLVRVDAETLQVRRFGMDDGLQDLEFNGGAQLRLADGTLAFGGIKGLNVFDPAHIDTSRFDPAVVLTGYSIGSRRHRELPLLHPDLLDLQQTDRVFRFGFASLDYADPASNRFEYLLEGFDAGWTELRGRAEVTYTNLDPGRYRLRVRGSNHDGRWSAQELDLPLVIHAPWWNSGIARLGYLFAALGVIFGFAALQQARLRQERALLLQIQEREERLKLALWGSGDEFWDWDFKANKVVRVGADQLLGMRAQHALSTDEWRSNAVHPDDLPRVQRLLQAHISGQAEAYESEHRIRNAQGEWTWVRARGKLVARDENGQPARMAGTARDITASRAAEGERRIAHEVLRSMGEAVCVVDLQFRFVSVNPAFERMTGYSEGEVLGAPSSLLDSAQQPPEFYRRLRESVERTGRWAGEIWQRRKDGEEFLGALELNEVRDGQGVRSHFVAVVSDITEKKRAEQELRYLANYDTLTGLPNRALLSERLARALVRARRADLKVAVLFLDLDRFKDINDTLGHSVGDRILKSAAARLLATVKETDTVARLGGDEFTVVLEDVQDLEQVERVASRVVHAFVTPLDMDGRSEVQISPSVGVALFPDHGQVPADLLKSADTAMYAAKARGRNTWQVYNDDMDAETRRRAAMLASLRRALDRGELRLEFQPKLSLADDRISGVEALLRWDSPELGSVPPTQFISLAEETGLILPIGE